MAGVRLVVAGVGLLVTNAVAQNVTWRGHPSVTITTAPSFTYSTTTFNYSAGTSTYLPLTDFSNEQLQFLWDQVRKALYTSVSGIWNRDSELCTSPLLLSDTPSACNASGLAFKNGPR